MFDMSLSKRGRRGASSGREGEREREATMILKFGLSIDFWGWWLAKWA